MPPVLLNEIGREKLFRDLGLSSIPDHDGADDDVDEDVEQVLAAFHGRSSATSPHIRQLAAVLESANLLDEAFEADAWAPGELETDPLLQDIFAKLRIVQPENTAGLEDRLPILPAAAAEALRTLAAGTVEMSDLLRISRSDPALASCIIRSANACLITPLEAIRDLERAITHIGLHSARNILIAASLRPLFASRALQPLWNHALEAAQVCERLAIASGSCSHAEAFLAGLVHDIGRLVIIQLPASFQESYARLLESGCPPIQIEKVLAGFTHADCGARTLRHWNFHPSIVDAVRDHHQLPDSPSPLASLLYLTEFWCAEEEDLPSGTLFKSALATTGLDMRQLGKPQGEFKRYVQMLQFAA